MASFVNKLRAMVGFKSPKKGETAEDCGAQFRALSERFFASEDEMLKAELWQQMCKTLPDTLFLAAMCYEDDHHAAPIRDRELHATIGARRLYERNKQIVTRSNPGYRLTEKTDSRRIHLRTLISQKTREVWVPIFTGFDEVMPMFGSNSRITVISFAEACQMAKAYKGVMINPGPNAIRLDNRELKKVL